jgi:cathepsin B
MRYFTLLLVSFYVCQSRGSKFTLCSDDDPLLEVTKVDISPIYPGEPVSVTYAAIPKVDIPESGVEGDVEIYVMGFKLAHASFDFCDELGSIHCPIQAGIPFEGTLSYTIPPEAPGGIEITTKIIIVNKETNTNLSCVEVKVRVGVRLENEFDHTLPAITSLLVSDVNSKATSWVAHMSSRFAQYTIEDAKRISNGTIMRGQINYESLPARKYVSFPHFDPPIVDELSVQMMLQSKVALGRQLTNSMSIPETFDSRTEWPACEGVIGRVRDQSDCGACWAFASTEALNDRKCIASLSRDQGDPDLSILSAEDTLSCCSGLSCGFSMGCNGGQPSAAWKWFVRRGVVSGLDYLDLGKGTSCKPYEFMPCAHHVDPAASGYPECPSSEYPTPSCTSECTDKMYNVSFDQDKRQANEAYSLRSVSDIQQDMLQHGPVTASFSVYSDFMTYQSGVYQHVTGSFLGGHAVKIIGWGVDASSGLDYWLIINSWNDSWGEKGLFRILRGKNECGIESQVVAGDA